MNRRNTILLLAIFLALAGYTYYTQLRPDASKGTNANTTPSPTAIAVFNFLTDNVSTFQVTDLQKNQTVAVTRQGKDDWHMQQPKDSATDPFRVTRAVGSLAHLDATRVLTNATDLTAYGLITRTLEARVTLSDTTEYLLQVGNPNPDKSAYYALKGTDKQVYLISSTTIQDLQDFVNNPPYPPTPTPAPLPTLPPTATLNGTTTPSGSETPGASPVPSATP